MHTGSPHHTHARYMPTCLPVHALERPALMSKFSGGRDLELNPHI